MRQATNQLVYQNGHEPTPEELAKAMDMSVERVREIQRMAQEPASLESPVGEEEDLSLIHIFLSMRPDQLLELLEQGTE